MLVKGVPGVSDFSYVDKMWKNRQLNCTAHFPNWYLSSGQHDGSARNLYETGWKTVIFLSDSGIIPGTGSANSRRRYNVTSFPIGWAHTQKDPWDSSHFFINSVTNVFQEHVNWMDLSRVHIFKMFSKGRVSKSQKNIMNAFSRC